MFKKNIKALIMWDEPLTDILIMSMSKRFKEGELVKVSTASDLFRMVQRYHPKMLIIDTEFPDCSCDEVIARLRQDPQNLDMYIISVMNKKSEEKRRKFILLGSNVVYHSPIDLHDFFSVFANALGLTYRKSPRFPVVAELKVSHNGKILTGTSANISKTGMLLELPEKLNENSKILVTFDPEDENGTISIESKVVRASVNNSEWWHGIAFENMKHESQFRLERFIMKIRKIRNSGRTL